MSNNRITHIRLNAADFEEESWHVVHLLGPKEEGDTSPRAHHWQVANPNLTEALRTAFAAIKKWNNGEDV